MESQEFIVLYTHQKMKKSKIWQDGILKINHLGNKAILYDDKGGCLDSVFLKHLEVKPGDGLESDRYLITVEEVKVSGSIAPKQNVIKEAAELNSRRFISSGQSLGCKPSGLKRKIPGFQLPRQVPKKMVTPEDGQSAASLEAKKSGPTFLSPFCSTSPLFSTAGKEDIKNMPTDPEDIVRYKNRERNGIPPCSVVSNPSFRVNREELCGENYLCSPISCINKHSDSLLTNKPTERDVLACHSLEISQNIRSKAQILALLTSKSTSTYNELNPEITEHFSQMPPQESLKLPTKPKSLVEQEKCAEVKSIEPVQYQHLSENTLRNKSRWAMYLSSQSSPTHSSDIERSDVKRKPKAQGDEVNTNTVQKKVRFFETYAEMGRKYNQDKRVDNNDPSSWDQEINFEIPSSGGSSNLPVIYNNAENDGLLAVQVFQGKNKLSFNYNDQVCIKGPSLNMASTQGVNTCVSPERACKQLVSSLPEVKHLQSESSLGNNVSISDDDTNMFSKSTANEGINSINEPMTNIMQPFLEVTFDLNNFETSETDEEESQESSKISQESENLVKEVFVSNGNSHVQKRHEDVSCKEICSEPSVFLTSVGDRPVKPFPIKETLPSPFSTRTYVEFDMEPCEAENPGEEREDSNDTLGNLDSSIEWSDTGHKIKGIKLNLQAHQCLSKATDQSAENNRLFSEDSQPQPVILGSDLDEDDEQVLASTSSDENGIPLLNINKKHSEYIAVDKSKTKFSISSFYPLEKKHCISQEAEAGSPTYEDLERTENLPHEHTETESVRDGKQFCNNPGNSSGHSELVNSVSLLRSLCEHRTALESLEILKKKNTSYKHQETQQTYVPDNSPEAWKPLTTVVSQAVPKFPHLNQDSPQQMLKEDEPAKAKCHQVGSEKEDEVEPNEPLESLQFCTLGGEEKNAFLSVTPKQIETCDHKLVEFQGHQVKGSATSAVMVRGHSSQPGGSLFLDSIDYENLVTDSCFPFSNCVQIDFVQSPDKENFLKGGTNFNIEDNFLKTIESDEGSVGNNSILSFPPEHSEHLYLDRNSRSTEKTMWEANKVTSPEQKISTLSPVSTFSLTSRDEDFLLEFSEESLRARTFPGMKKPVSLEKKNLQKFPLVSRTQGPLITLPSAGVPPDLDCCSCGINWDTQESSGSPVFSLYDESALLSLGFESEDQRETCFFEDSREETLQGLSLFSNVSTKSKWLKYQNTPQCNLTTPEKVDEKIRDGFFAEAVYGMHLNDTGERQSVAVNKRSLDSLHLQMIKGMLYQQQQDFNSQDLVSRKMTLSLNLEQTPKTEEIHSVLGESACYNCSVTGCVQEINASELSFPSGQKIKSTYLPQRQIHIPAVFQSPAHYKQIFTSCLIEHLNILLFLLSQRLYKALSKVDISFYTSSKEEKQKNVENTVPSCYHHQPAKLVMVKKEGPNKGRLFYACDGPKADRCQFFKWLEEASSGCSTQAESRPSMVLSDIKSIGVYLRSQKIPLYEECQLLVRKGYDFQGKRYGKLKKFSTVNPEFYDEPKSKLYLKLSRRESSSTYSKDDLWVVSKTLDFELDTFIACSAFFGPSSMNEVELLPLKGYFPSNWPTNMVVHALLVCNASTELTTLKNIQSYFNPATLPLVQHLLTMSSPATVNKGDSKRKFIPPAFRNINTKFELSQGISLQLAGELIQVHKLNKDQAAALIQIAQMMASHGSDEVEKLQTHTLPITIIHGVFGAGKSYLLAVVILFFVQLFEKSEVPTVGNARPWKVLISSSTNVAVDRVLLGLLSLGFEKFVRVGSIRKIAKPILPYSLHAGSENESEQLKELHALMKEDLTHVERLYVRKSIEQHKLGTNRTLLKQACGLSSLYFCYFHFICGYNDSVEVRVVGVTCAACPFPCLNNLKFPVVVLDECSQITEPASLLPVARFECEKLILVGDPKQLPPTIQGSDAAHENGLEQTLFDRLCLMRKRNSSETKKIVKFQGHKPILLRTQYRCHPAISAVANNLFYEGNLVNGVSETERSPLLEWLPTLCFYNVKGLEQIERDNSFHNVAEAAFALKLIQSLIASGIAGSMIGVITLYKSQMYKLCHLLSAVDFDHSNIKAVQVSTVDAFQGAEKEIIILSCVRTRQVGFIDSEKRVNVALTRGKRHLLIVGNLACLRKNRLWGRVIQHCEGREDGLQHASQCEPQLNHLLEDYLEKQKGEKDKSQSKSLSQKDIV